MGTDVKESSYGVS